MIALIHQKKKNIRDQSLFTQPKILHGESYSNYTHLPQSHTVLLEMWFFLENLVPYRET